MEIHVVRGDNRHLYGRLLDENFRRRADIFVEEMRWRALRRIDDRERDQFDTPEATYILAVEDGRLLGGIRLHPSTGPTLMSEVFPHLAAAGVGSTPDLWEGTRLYIVPERRTEHPNKVSGVLHWAAWAYALRQGVRAIRLVTWASFVPHLMRSGLRPRPLGLPTPHEDMTLIAVETAVDEQALVDMLAYYDIEPVQILDEGIGERGRDAA